MRAVRERRQTTLKSSPDIYPPPPPPPHPTSQLLKMVDPKQAEQVAQEYSQKAEDFDRRRDDYLREHPESGGMRTDMDWQREVEAEQNMRLVADMQVQLQSEIRYGGMDGAAVEATLPKQFGRLATVGSW